MIRERAKKLQKQIHKWLKTRDFDSSVRWEFPENPGGKAPGERAIQAIGFMEFPGVPEIIDSEQVYLILGLSGDFDLFDSDEDEVEFDKIVGAHGFWYDYKDCLTLVFMDAPELQSPNTVQSKKKKV